MKKLFFVALLGIGVGAKAQVVVVRHAPGVVVVRHAPAVVVVRPVPRAVVVERPVVCFAPLLRYRRIVF